MSLAFAVTTDFSEASGQAFATAAALARRFDASLYLIHAVQGAGIHTPWRTETVSRKDLEDRQQELQAKLEDFAEDEPAFEGLDVKAKALLGSETAEAVQRFQEAAEIDLIVVSSHGHTGIQHFLLGSFAGKILQLSSCPVLICRAAERAAETFNPKRILAPHDFSRPSTFALQVAHSWAQRFDAATRLLFVAEETVEAYKYPTGTTDSVAEFFEWVRAEGTDALQQLIQRDWKDLAAEAVARIGHPAVEILSEANDFRADLIVMASRGLSLFERLHVGSVAERVVERASCPVLVVKRKENGGGLLG